MSEVPEHMITGQFLPSREDVLAAVKLPERKTADDNREEVDSNEGSGGVPAIKVLQHGLPIARDFVVEKDGRHQRPETFPDYGMYPCFNRSFNLSD